MTEEAAGNQLAGEASAYLRAHGAQAIAWQPWSRRAFDTARQQNKPVFVSIGYLACYWCHVMSKESFDDPAVAAALARDFIAVKVDREERPDVDRMVLDAMVRLGARTGWPVSAFMTPEGQVFAGGSYYPPEPRHGLPSFSQALAEALAKYANAGSDGNAQSASSKREPGTPARGMNDTAANGSATADIEHYAEFLANRLLDNIDTIYGGFGLNAPKFPQPALHELLWRIHAWTGKPAFRTAIVGSMTRICRSALFDHVGGGFHRYCVDEAWTEPHFEKMLYDNAQMIELLSWLWRGSHSQLFADRIEQTIDWATREMLVPGLGFASSLSAYSPDHGRTDAGDPGTFYLWTADEIAAVLGGDREPFARAYQLHPFPGVAGASIAQSESIVDGPTALDPLAACRGRLLAHRATRDRPERDDKVLGDWNGLMIVALVEAGAAFGRTEWIELAQRVFDDVVAALAEGTRLRHCTVDGRPGPEGLLEDYASMSRAALRLHEVSGDARSLELAVGWVEHLDALFWDGARGGYFASSAESWRPGERLRTITETSLPSGNGMMIGVLARLYEILGDGGRYHDRAERLVDGFRADIVRHGIAAATALNNILTLNRFVRINVFGPLDDPAAETLLRAALSSCLPDRMVLRDRTAPAEPGAQVCVGTRCLLPLGDADALRHLLEPGQLSRAA